MMIPPVGVDLITMNLIFHVKAWRTGRYYSIYMLLLTRWIPWWWFCCWFVHYCRHSIPSFFRLLFKKIRHLHQRRYIDDPNFFINVSIDLHLILAENGHGPPPNPTVPNRPAFQSRRLNKVIHRIVPQIIVGYCCWCWCWFGHQSFNRWCLFFGVLRGRMQQFRLVVVELII